MFQRWREAGLVLPTLLTLAMLPVLIGLGTWQVQRLAWKQDLISKIEARRTAEPVSYVAALSKLVQDGDVDYLRVRVTGSFDNSQERHFYDPRTEAQGWDVYTLFQPDGELPPLFVNRGWVPDALKDASKRTEGQLSGSQTVVGLARVVHPKGYFTPDNDIAGNRWFYRDVDAMRWGAAGPPAGIEFALGKTKAVAPFTLDAEAEPANPGGFPRGGTTEVHLTNNHLQYVVTWYGFALTLIAVFVIYARQRLKALKNGPMQP